MTYGSFKLSLFAVSVPVLSEHSISTPARDSMAVSFLDDGMSAGEVGGADGEGRGGYDR